VLVIGAISCLWRALWPVSASRSSFYVGGGAGGEGVAVTHVAVVAVAAAVVVVVAVFADDVIDVAVGV